MVTEFALQHPGWFTVCLFIVVMGASSVVDAVAKIWWKR